MTDLRYPIGRFTPPEPITPEAIQAAVEAIAALPTELRAVTSGLTEAQLDTPYRPEGWTVRQVIHHVADSHMNSYIRLRLALTEEEPTIKAYNEAAWARLPDAEHEPIEVSLDLIEAMHGRWVSLLRSLGNDQWKRTFRHPERGLTPLDVNTMLYAWHGRHHLAHIANLKSRNNW